MDIHIHVWEGDEIVAEGDLQYTGQYDDHLQFSGEIGVQHIEIRVFKSQLLEMVKESLDYQKR